ncbi:MAG: hypothetical protein AAFR23_01475 [Pseudomonadota bacterium]
MVERKSDEITTQPAGFAIGYARDKGGFRVYFATLFALIAAAIAWNTGNGAAMVVTAMFGVAAFYFYPLIEHDRVRLGANEYGIFIEGFGLIAWRGIKTIRVATRAVRNIEINELEITLSRGINDAVLADWRDLPWHRLLMRLPWRMPNDRVLLVDLEPFAGRASTTLGEIQRRWRYFG